MHANVHEITVNCFVTVQGRKPQVLSTSKALSFDTFGNMFLILKNLPHNIFHFLKNLPKVQGSRPRIFDIWLRKNLVQKLGNIYFLSYFSVKNCQPVLVTLA